MIVALDLFESYLRNKDLKDRTIENYLYYFNKFNYEVFNQETVSKFMAQAPNRNSIARGFLLNMKKYLVVNYQELGLSPESKANVSDVELPSLTGRKKTRVIRPIPHEQIFIIAQQFDTERERLQLLFSYFCALRLGELFKVTVISFDWETWNKDRTKRGKCIVLGKGDKEGVAWVPADIMTRIAKYIHSQELPSVNSCLFRDPGKEYNFNALARNWQLKLAAAARRAGVSKVDENGKVIKETAVHPHRLRHSYGSYLINVKKMDVRKVQILLRHSDISSTQIYTHIEEDALESELNLIDSAEK